MSTTLARIGRLVLFSILVLPLVVAGDAWAQPAPAARSANSPPQQFEPPPESLLLAPAVSPPLLRDYIAVQIRLDPRVKQVISPNVMTVEAQTSDGRTLTFHLANLVDTLNAPANRDRASRDREIRRVLTAYLTMIARPAGQATRERFIASLMPVIKNVAYVEAFAKTIRQASASAESRLLYRPIAGDVVLALGADEPTRVRLLPVDSGRPYGLSDDELFALAKRNLAKRVSRLRLQEIGPIKLIDFDRDYNASLLVIDDVWQALAVGALTAGKEDDIVVAVPARDALAIGSASDAAGLDELRRIAALPNQAYPITGKLLRRRGKGWVVFE